MEIIFSFIGNSQWYSSANQSIPDWLFITQSRVLKAGWLTQENMRGQLITQCKTASILGREFDLTEFFNRTGHQKEDLIQHCQWKSNTCNESSWETVFTHYGKCYMFNKDGNHLLKKAGAGRRSCDTEISTRFVNKILHKNHLPLSGCV